MKMYVKKQIKILKDSFTESLRESSSNWISLNLPVPVQTKECGGRKIEYLIHNSGVLRFYNLPSTVPGAGAVKDSQGNGRILVNDAFTTLPEDIQIAILLHEEGHLVNEDVAPKYYVLKRLLGDKDILQQEFNADLYSLRNGGQMYNALCWMRESGYYNSKEINKRLLNLLVEGGR